jgi:hypothetical protein
MTLTEFFTVFGFVASISAFLIVVNDLEDLDGHP